MTWKAYETDLDKRLEDWHSRVHRGAYRALPSKRAYIPKPDGRQHRALQNREASPRSAGSLHGGCRNVGWNFILRRRKSSMARMTIEGEGMFRKSLIFWAIPSVPEARRVGKGNTSSISLRPFLIKPARPFGDRSVRGRCACAATRRLRVFPVCLTRSSGVGFNTMGGSTARHSILSGSTSIACSLGGRRGNTRSCTTILGELSSGSCAYLSAIRDSSLTGNWVGSVALQWEPYELRGSRPVLRERGGATPPRHSPGHFARVPGCFQIPSGIG